MLAKKFDKKIKQPQQQEEEEENFWQACLAGLGMIGLFCAIMALLTLGGAYLGGEEWLNAALYR